MRLLLVLLAALCLMPPALAHGEFDGSSVVNMQPIIASTVRDNSTQVDIMPQINALREGDLLILTMRVAGPGSVQATLEREGAAEEAPTTVVASWTFQPGGLSETVGVVLPARGNHSLVFATLSEEPTEFGFMVDHPTVTPWRRLPGWCELYASPSCLDAIPADVDHPVALFPYRESRGGGERRVSIAEPAYYGLEVELLSGSAGQLWPGGVVSLARSEEGTEGNEGIVRHVLDFEATNGTHYWLLARASSTYPQGSRPVDSNVFYPDQTQAFFGDRASNDTPVPSLLVVAGLVAAAWVGKRKKETGPTYGAGSVCDRL